ncbi:dTMP kinase [Spirobacillus cienkowskii]|uniref:dTMP kinase n=1 Tax=Spirobacillus cienkowskii TaxID=495820 RepID=UPI0030CB4B9F
MAFIVFEGGEGVGKSTQIDRLFKALQHKHKACCRTREPGGTPFAENIRGLFKTIDAHSDAPLPLTELLLIAAARHQHIQKLIKPELNKGTIVLCDRFVDSTYVYQNIVGGVSKQVVDDILGVVLDEICPDLTFVFTATLENSLARIHKEKSRVSDRLDSYDESVHAAIHKGYFTVFDTPYAYPSGKVPHRILVDANASIEQVFDVIQSAVAQHLGINL